ncbi:hypothetical protein NIES2135_09360 [Leptolyngbya boryana NIES-2135]|jgi:hypothetical protein|uniref:DUF2330 domain-containing protein n=1 Tax=Leptolyngbya boryana NIES-2135 TaxID=1973484 RepID=A0A1Z4JBJ3_LEPBY|nr:MULTISPECIES: DUF2330 domain-containing protein [Leptolyngbya]BAY54122.1 hypothetical protein NIES2135_09360 [Leptolyngbya boryana NIES-2135]MBD2369778.1 DUF2330 domain-containing protein [Leptolyngbya sp. FACHB-161]MBD2376021.1 DUF2330 domain-containing protein [Leptolyngbya sp. FACHB-238]MBD2400297.1 DUF2330 domain-containing protein [Leptolyngbya sp. FACHB-239]MBD2406838.1 DUF2330 domain-containing protein [Leptolyngbya sp. FACHB-402]
MKSFRILCALLIIGLSCFFFVPKAWAFCGFYVAKADAKLYNQASQVAIARSGDHTVLTMANDYQGEVKDFAIVVPVPTVLQKEQVKVSDPKIIERLDAFSAPRLVEYFDPDPCETIDDRVLRMPMPSAPMSEANEAVRSRQGSLGVTVEAKFTVGEYDILILSAKESGGLETWLVENGYKIPRGAKQLLKPYIRQKLKFFVAKVNLDEFDKAGFQSLRPLQITYDSPRFMLPIRLGMINAQAAQDLIVYILSPKGQAEVTNYRTVKVPSDSEVPLFVKDEFSHFYKSMFEKSYDREDRKVAFLEYAWNMGNCDPCSAEPLNPEELKQAGVFWLEGSEPVVMPRGRRRPVVSSDVFITRLHVRYTRDKFPEDLMFQETNQQETFQGRYVLRHPFNGKTDCPAGRRYQRSLRQRFEEQAQTLARLTGWNIDEIRKKQPQVQSQLPWWQDVLMSISGM